MVKGEVCGVNLFNETERDVLTFGGCLSVACLSVIFYLVYLCDIPNLKRHPINIIIRKSFFELLFVSQYLWMGFAPPSFFWTETNDDGPCNSNPYIWPLSWLTQFSLLGGELWFWVLSVDIHVALTNPFSNNISNSARYSALVLGTAAVTATILVNIKPIHYGLSSDPMIWVKDQKNATNWTKVGMFYAFLPLIYVYCGAVAIWARWQIRRGLEVTLQKRKYSVRKQTAYVIGYMLFWTCVYVFQFTLYLQQQSESFQISNGAGFSFQLISGFLLASRGVWSLGTFLVANWSAITNYLHNEQSRPLSGEQVPPKEEEEQVQLNVALQAEIVNFTALGIQRAVRDLRELAKLSQSQRSSNSRYSSFNLFNIKMPGEYVSFMVKDPAFSNSLNSLPDSTKRNHSRGSSVDRSVDLDDPMTENPLARASLPLSPRDTFMSRQSTTSVIRIGDSKVTEEVVAYDIRHNNTSKSALDLRSSIAARIDNLTARFIPKRNSFHFTDYSPQRFARIRQLSGVSDESYVASFNSTTMPSFSEGRSGAFVYFSMDAKYIVKTTTEQEFEKLLNLLAKYEEYLAAENEKGRYSLLPRFMGAHRIVMYDIPLYFVVMKNVCPVVDEKYDLKGSWINRHGSKKNKDPAKVRPKKYYSTLTGSFRHTLPGVDEKESTPLFLDNDLKNSFLMYPEDANALAAQLSRDTKFLQDFNLMDYSLLVGVKRRTFLVNSSGSSRSTSHVDTYSVRTSSVSDNPLFSPAMLSYAPPPTTTSPNQSTTSHAKKMSVDQVVDGGGVKVSQRGPRSSEHEDQYHAAAVEGAGAFYFGIIDILQDWDWRKWQERAFKVHILRKDGVGLSAMEPVGYRSRFLQRAVVDIFSNVDSIPEDALGNERAPSANAIKPTFVMEP